VECEESDCRAGKVPRLLIAGDDGCEWTHLWGLDGPATPVHAWDLYSGCQDK
jgi:hypothetical protein